MREIRANLTEEELEQMLLHNSERRREIPANLTEEELEQMRLHNTC
jgi:hypothetical protein